MIRIIKTLSIPLLLAFLVFSFSQISLNIPHSHTAVKAVINLEDWKVKTQSDDEKKQPIILQVLFILTFILLTTVILLHYVSMSYNRKFFFLIPIFNQSNYVITPPF